MDEVGGIIGQKPWNKIVLSKTNNEWESANCNKKPSKKGKGRKAKAENNDFESNDSNDPQNIKNEPTEPEIEIKETSEPIPKDFIASRRKKRTRPKMVESYAEEDPLALDTPKKTRKPKRQRAKQKPKQRVETVEQRAIRLAKMSAYAAKRLADETPVQRAARLTRMSSYAARRLATETAEQRAARLARMSAYAARKLANESPEQRQARLSRMSAYAARRSVIKRFLGNDSYPMIPNDGDKSMNDYPMDTSSPSIMQPIMPASDNVYGNNLS